MRLQKSNSYESAPRRESVSQKEEPAKSRHTDRPSDSEIRKKIEDNKIKSLRKNESNKKLRAMERQVKLEAQAEAENKTDVEMENDEYQLKSDVSLNDPKDPNTGEKLKTLLQNGGFVFNEKEKAALSQILNK